MPGVEKVRGCIAFMKKLCVSDGAWLDRLPNFFDLFGPRRC